MKGRLMPPFTQEFNGTLCQKSTFSDGANQCLYVARDRELLADSKQRRVLMVSPSGVQALVRFAQHC